MSRDEVTGRVTKLQAPVLGLTRYINVDATVGPNQRNQDFDVRTVAALIAICVKDAIPGVDPPKNIRDSRFNATIGFWIFHFQRRQFSAKRTGDVDGIVSPSNALGRYSNGFHTIVLINAEARQRDPVFFDAVCDGKTALSTVD